MGESSEALDIVFTSRDSTSSSTQLFTSAPDGSQRTRLTRTDEYSYNMPVWSPDRRWIAAVRWQTRRRQGTDLVLVRPVDGADSVVAHFPGEAYFPDWSTDGTRIVLLAGAAYPAWAVNIVTLASAEVRELLATDSIWLSAPVESPDGRHILLTGSEQSPCTPIQAQQVSLDQDVYIMNADGSRLRRLTDDPMLSNMARWAPDGSEIVFVSDRYASRNDWATFLDSTELYVMRRDGSGMRRLTRNRVLDLHPHW